MRKGKKKLSPQEIDQLKRARVRDLQALRELNVSTWSGEGKEPVIEGLAQRLMKLSNESAVRVLENFYLPHPQYETQIPYEFYDRLLVRTWTGDATQEELEAFPLEGLIKLAEEDLDALKLLYPNPTGMGTAPSTPSPRPAWSWAFLVAWPNGWGRLNRPSPRLRRTGIRIKKKWKRRRLSFQIGRQFYF